jgi:hypothetical protein
VLDSAGNVVKGLTNLSNDGNSVWDSGTPTAAQLSNGRIVVAWTAWNNGSYSPRYAVLNATYGPVSGPTMLDNRFATTGNWAISVVPDQYGRAALTWTDNDGNARNALYYALVDQAGTLLTPPMIFHRSPTGRDLQTGWYGQSATTYSSSIQAIDGALVAGSALVGGRPGGNAGMPLRLANHGTSSLGPSSNPATLTAQLAGGLTYAGDTLGVTPNISGNTVSWNLPDMAFLDSRQFTLWLAVPASATIGQRSHVSLELVVPGDSNTTDNAAAYDVMAARQGYLPVLRK